MKNRLFKLFTAVMAFVMLFGAMSICPTSAATASELRQNISNLEAQSKKLESEIKALQGQINSQKAIKEKLQEKINLVQQQINACNSEISKINAEIDKNNKEIAQDKLTYKKRLRAIHTSNSGSNVQILLGAKTFSEFLQLAQYTTAVSKRDQKLITRLEEKIEENQKLLNEQVEIRKTITAKQQELQAENDKIQAVINQIDSDQSQLEQDNAKIEKQIKEYNATLASMATTNGTSFVYDGGAFLWPVPGHYYISAGWQSNDSVHKGRHYGIDISGGGIQGKPIVAIADGVVTRSNNSCTHNYKKNGSCGCGGGYGNYVTINHGTLNGNTYVATYGHMVSTAVGAGATVKKGQTIGYVGTTGWSTGYHLHFGLAVNGSWVNPMNYFKRVG